MIRGNDSLILPRRSVLIGSLPHPLIEGLEKTIKYFEALVREPGITALIGEDPRKAAKI